MMRPLLEAAADRAARYLEGLRERPVAPTPGAIARLAELETALPDKPCDPTEVLEQLDEVGSPATMGMAGPRFFGFVIGGSLPAALAANWLAGAWDQMSAFEASSPGAARFERVSMRWILELLGLPRECGVGFVTGASVANLAALAAGRHRVLRQAGWDVEADGLFGAPPITVIVGDEGHPSLFKALGLLGLGRRRTVRVPVDGQGRMRADALPPLAGPTIICTQAGNVNTGAIDPVGEICEKAHQAGSWVHVDGAFGLWAAASPQYAGLTAGVENADSWATDAHKWLNVPYDSGLAILRDAEALRAAMSVSAEYLPAAGQGRNPSDFTPEMSRRARGVEIWAALRSLGRSGVAELVERCCRLARRFAEGLEEAGYRVLNDVVLNQVLVSFGEGETTARVIEALQVDGTCWCGITRWQGRPAMRISVSSWATTEDDVDRSLDAMLRIARSQ